MNDTIKIKGGSVKTPELQDRELGYNRKEKALYIGTPDGNVRLCSEKDLADAKTYADEVVATANKYADELIVEAKKYIDELMTEVNKRLTDLENPEEPEGGEVNG